MRRTEMMRQGKRDGTSLLSEAAEYARLGGAGGLVADAARRTLLGSAGGLVADALRNSKGLGTDILPVARAFPKLSDFLVRPETIRAVKGDSFANGPVAGGLLAAAVAGWGRQRIEPVALPPAEPVKVYLAGPSDYFESGEDLELDDDLEADDEELDVDEELDEELDLDDGDAG